MPDAWSREQVLQNNQSAVIYLLYLNCAEMLATYNLKYSYTREALCLLTHTKGIRSVHLHKNYTLDSISI